LLVEIEKGYYSDPPDVNFYSYEVDKKGEVRKDKFGIPFLRSSRGTNLVESIHRQMNTTFRHRCGIELGHTQLGERRHRHNIDVAVRNYTEFPWVGHYDTWNIDLLQNLVEENTGTLLFPSWQNISDYEDTAESFITVPLHNKELDTRLHERVTQLKEQKRYSPSLTQDVTFLCREWEVDLPFLPVMKKEEFRLFSTLMLGGSMTGFDAEKMALLWIGHVDGVNIFPKLPAQLREYYQRWERNSRIQAPQKKAKKYTDLLSEYLHGKRPQEIQINEHVIELATERTQNVPVNNAAVKIAVASIQPRQLTAAPMPQPIPEVMRRAPNAGSIIVGDEPLGAAQGAVELPPQLPHKKRGQRGGDRGFRRTKRCRICRNSGIQHFMETAEDCIGKTDNQKCRLVRGQQEQNNSA